MRRAIWAAAFGILGCRTPETPSVVQGPTSSPLITSALPPVPDFSFAGFRGGAPIPEVSALLPRFDVTKYGAVADDEGCDRDAIEAAARAANRGGVVYLPPGTFLLDCDDDRPTQLLGTQFVLKGAGAHRTRLHARKSLPPQEADKIGSVPFRLLVGGLDTDGPALAKVVAPAEPETFELVVDSTESLAPGQWITLRASGPKLAARMVEPYRVHPLWKATFKSGVQIGEHHRIARIEGTKVFLETPIHVEVRPALGFAVAAYHPVEEVGIEDLTISGDWKGTFEHHEDAEGDAGFSGLELRGVVNGWLRRVRFENLNRGLRIADSAQVTATNVELLGTPGHVSVVVRESTHVRVGPGVDRAGHYHGPAVSNGSAGTVYWQWSFGRDAAFDGHGGGPYATLLDQVRGGWTFGRSGGDLPTRPNHLGGFVLWGFEYLGDRRTVDFWSKDMRATDRFVRPIIVGLGGRPIEVLKSKVAYLGPLPSDSPSLYAAQLEKRLGRKPTELWAELEALKTFVVSAAE